MTNSKETPSLSDESFFRRDSYTIFSPKGKILGVVVPRLIASYLIMEGKLAPEVIAPMSIYDQVHPNPVADASRDEEE